MTRLRFVLLLSLLSFPAAAQPAQVACFLGDSITLGVQSPSTPWPQLLGTRRANQRFSVVNLGAGGMRCDELESGGTATCTGCRSFLESVVRRGCTRLFLFCGVNDFMQSKTAAQVYGTGDTNDSDRGPWLRMVRAAQAAGIPVTGATVAPWKGHGQWTTAKQAQQDAFNASVRATSGITVVDFYVSHGDPSDAQALRAVTAPSYAGTPADFLHWGTAGNVAAADKVDATAGAL